jgi:transcriptional regulator with XRE-family HTH domain
MQLHYKDRLSHNLRTKVEEQGFQFYKGLPSVTARTLYRLESQDSDPTLSTLEKICLDLGCEIQDLFD